MHLVLTVNAGFNLVNFRAGLMRALLADGHRVTALVPPSEHDATLRGWGVETYPLEMDAKGASPVADYALMRRMRDAFRELRPDAVLSWTIKNNIYGALAARPLGIPVVPNVTGLGTAFLSSGLMARVAQGLYRRAFAKLPVVFFQNGDDRALFEQRRLVRSDQAVQLPGSGIDLTRFDVPPLPGTPRFTMIARLLRDKGVAEYMEAAARVRIAHPEARFDLVGPLGVANRSAIDAPTLEGWLAEGHVSWHGALADVRPVIATSDVIVLPSYREGMPRTLLEGAAMGRPAVTTDVPGCRDAIVAEETGLLANVRDGADLARACTRMIALGAEGRARMGQAARARMEALFDERLVIDAYRKALADL